MKKNEYVWCVYCNTDPILYAIYKNKQKAVRYAISLIRYRRERAEYLNHEFGYYHFHPLPQPSTLAAMERDNMFESRDATIFSACLKVKDNFESFTDDGCMIKVQRRLLS